MGKFKDLIAGTRYERLTLMSATPKTSLYPSGRKKYQFECRCDCGNITWLTRQDFTTGHTKSCGCYRVDLNTLPKECWKQAGFFELLGDYKSAAKSRDLMFTLTQEEFRELTSKSCAYCGMAPSQVRLHSSKNPLYGSYTYSGLDRIDSSLGYVSNNCVPACNMCNIAKKDYSPVEFLTWIEKVYKFQKGI